MAGEAPTAVDTAPSEITTEELVGMRRVRHELNRLAESDERIVTLANTADAVRVDLRADAEALAARLHEQYGDAVELLVGNMPYPPSKIPDDFRCPSPRVQPWPSGVTAAFELDDDTVPQGGTAHGVVTVHNASDEQFVLEVKSSVLVGWVYDVGEMSTPRGHPGVYFVPVGDGGSEPTGPRRVLAPGQDTSIGVPVGTASCDPARGYALAPGDYDVRARVGVPGRVYLSQPARLHVTPR